MTIQKQTIPQTNYEVGRRGKSVNKVLIHWMVGTLASADAQFKKLNSTSANYGIENNVVYQWVDEKNTAYHAGNFTVNLESIGIEHSASPDRPATEETYKTSGALVRDICKRYNIPIDRSHILKHSEVTPTQCCGTIDIDKIIRYANEGSLPITPPPMNTDDRAYFFDLIFNSNTGFDWGTTDSKKVTKEKVAEFNQWTLNNKNGNGKWDQINLLGWGVPVDTRKTMPQQLYDHIKGTGVDTAKIREEGRKAGVKQVQDVVAKQV